MFYPCGKYLEYDNIFHIFNFGFSNINMSLAEGYKRNYKKEKGNLYCDHNMAGDYNTVPVL